MHQGDGVKFRGGGRGHLLLSLPQEGDGVLTRDGGWCQPVRGRRRHTDRGTSSQHRGREGGRGARGVR